MAYRNRNGNGTVCIIGDFDETSGDFSEISQQAIDNGIDFYAPQTVETPDGRRVMIAWMQNWDSCSIREEGSPWAGQMTLPREIFIKDGRLWQKPSREFEFLKKKEFSIPNLIIRNERLSIKEVKGRMLAMDLLIRPKAGCYSFSIRLAEDKDSYTELVYRIHEHTLTLDRRCSGSRRHFFQR